MGGRGGGGKGQKETRNKAEKEAETEHRRKQRQGIERGKGRAQKEAGNFLPFSLTQMETERELNREKKGRISFLLSPSPRLSIKPSLHIANTAGITY